MYIFARMLPVPQLMSRSLHPDDKIALTDIVNYQVFTSGITLRDTFLINLNTGATWQLMHDPERDEDFWSVIQ